MKRLFHILIPLLLSLLILISIGWYFLKYDPEFTRDILLSQARYQDEIGNHSAAVWFYDLAYLQSDRDDSVALELADQYIAIGNFTKAEYTLSHAIADGANVELYIALCNTYVQQNKLLDAVTMLNNVADPAIKEQLNAMRPQAPAPSYAPGTYSQYIQLDFNAANGLCYISMDRRFPSMETDVFTEAVTLSAGETVFYGVTVAPNGLVSPLGIYSYVVGGIIEQITFQDPAFETALRQQLGLGEHAPIYSNELWNVTKLTLPSDVTDYTDLKWLPDLEELTAQNCAAKSLAPIGQLSKLQTLQITGTVLGSADLKMIASLPELRSLSLPGCQISTISSLAGAKKLTYLDLSNNPIRDISVISGMQRLQTLYLQQNAIVNLDALKGLKQLQTLDVSHNSISSLAPLSDLFALRYLNVSSNDLMTLAGIENLTGLTHLLASQNNMTDILPLSLLTQLQVLDISNNTVLNIDPVGAMLKLEELDFSHNEVSTLPVFDKHCALINIRGDYNLLSSLENLSGLHNLNYIYMDYNSDIKSVAGLQTCHLLVLVSVYATKVSDVQALKDMNIEVLYDPT
jgi:Leucine-rich repeat (LRR) protein